ncbi:hypothetical protein H072_6393 [Dactylellina haptotyla CBS 200.50]|uniref:Alpha/beta hydrolase fold-3 domain-containing protein n=1 Tax=Dactylellina haptotyla (strain CBS 200.50) TaxID=1284197 RepID=S8AAE6_DACHA|nr:hypothetical protein H072_6393 [Dactylellina haptotyla CBS 200.50]
MESISRKPEDLLKLADLHPELAAWLQAHPFPAPPQDLVGLRAVYEKLNQRYVGAITRDQDTDITIENRTILARDGYDIPIRIYRAPSSTEPGPLIVAIHGGAKLMGTLTDEEGHCRLFAEEFNATCINIGYRLSPEYKTPTMVYDCWDVVKWAAEHADEIGSDPKKGFIVYGSSSGGQIADIIGHFSLEEKLEPPVTGLIEICTSSCQYDVIPKEYKDEFLSWDQDIKGGLGRDTLIRFYHLTGAADDPSNRLNSPLLWPGGHKGLAPVFFQVHGRDFTRDTALIYERVLKEQGVETKLKIYPGAPHGFNTIFFETELAKQHEKDTADGIRWLLGLVTGN